MTNANYIKALLVDLDGDLWTSGSGGVVHWEAETGEYIKYTTEDGLASNYVKSIAQTDDGAMWFGTCSGGISHFDGTHWTTFTTQDGLLSNCIQSIAVTPDGALWFGSYEGITRYDGKSWKTFDGTNTHGLLSRADVLTVSYDGALWIGSHENGGLIRYDGQDWTDFSLNIPNKSITAIAFGPDELMVVGTRDELYQYKNGNWKELSVTNPADPEENTCVSAISITPNGEIWVGFSLYEIMDVHRENFPKHENIFMGAMHYNGSAWNVVDIDDGLVSNEITAITIGLDGLVWFGSFDRGVSSFDGQKWTRYLTNDILPSNNVYAIDVTESGYIWLSQPNAASYFDGQQWTTYNQIGSLEYNDVRQIFIDDNESVWFGTFDGIAHLEGNDWTTYSEKEFEWLKSISCMAKGSDGVYYFGSFTRGVSQFDGKTWKRLARVIDVDVQTLLVSSQGSLWIGTSLEGLYYYNDEHWEHYTKVNGLLENTITALDEAPNGTICAGTFSGISCFDGTQWISYTSKDGFTSGVTDLLFDQNGILWVGSNNGLYRFDGNVWIRYTSEDGLADNSIYDITLSSDEIIWIATSGGLSQFFSERKPGE